jgi:hypothetical protein
MSTVKAVNFQHPSATDPAVELDAAGKLWLAGAKVLQIVRATDATQRTTTSATFVDASISVTITPQKSTSAILLIWSVGVAVASTKFTFIQITDNSNNAISGAETNETYSDSGVIIARQTLFGYATPATSSAVTFKGRFRIDGGAVAGTLRNANSTGQLYAIEVSA